MRLALHLAAEANGRTLINLPIVPMKFKPWENILSS